MWISLDDIETLELTYRGSQWRGHTPKNTFRLQSLQGFPDQEGSRWAGGCSDGPHSWENLNLAGHFFRYGWSASVMWDGQRCREAPTVSDQRKEDIKGAGRPVESDPRSSLAQSVTLSTPGLSRSQPRCHRSSSSCPRGPVFIHSHSQHPRFPVKVTLWHLLDRTGREGKGAVGSVCEPLTQWPCDLFEHQSGPVLQQWAATSSSKV